MGYSYGRTARGGQGLACDGCGKVGGVRKRTCPHSVLWDSLRDSSGQRHPVSYCYPPALCSDCFKARGGGAKVHADCKAAAAAQTAKHDAIEAALDAGELFVVSAEGSRRGKYGNDVPEGQVLVTFVGRGYQPQQQYLIPDASYDAARIDGKQKLSEYPEAVPA